MVEEIEEASLVSNDGCRSQIWAIMMLVAMVVEESCSLRACERVILKMTQKLQRRSGCSMWKL